jgi:putative ABC transport system permease protein
VSGSWRAALRLARREVWRARGRSALVAAMVGVPVLLIMTLLILLRTIGAAEAEEARMLRALGAAEAKITTVGRMPLVQDHLGHTAPDENASPGQDERPWTAEQIAQVAGGRAVPVREGGVLIRTDAGAVSARARELDVRDPVTRGLATLVEGRAPARTDEVLVSQALAERGFGPGEIVQLAGLGERTVVGVVRNPAAFRESALVGLFGSVLTDDVEREYLVDTGGAPVSWSKVRELNALGLGVVSRAVLNDPPPADQLPDQLRTTVIGSDPADVLALPIMAGACIVLEIALLAGPAFAVGARRQSRQFALVVAAGGTPVDVRRIVLAQGLVLGLGAAVLGAALAIVANVAGRPVIEWLAGAELGPLKVWPLDLLVVVGVGAFAAMAAAIVPAAQASRQDTVAALAGRRGSVRPHRGWPVIGLAVGAGGVALAAAGMGASSGGEMPVVFGTFALVAGAIMVTPTLLGAVGGLGRRLPLSLRLAARDTARHRSRTASAVSAIMGTLIGLTAMAIGSASDFAEERRDYVPREAMGSLTITFDNNRGPGRLEIPDGNAEALADQVERLLPGRSATVAYGGGGRLADGQYENVDLLEPRCQPTTDQPCVWAYGLDGLISYGLPMIVADADTIGTLVGRQLTAEQRDTLERGGVLVPDQETLTPEGDARIQIWSTAWGRQRQPELAVLSAAVLPELSVREGGSVRLVASIASTRATAERLGLTVAAQQIVVPPGEPAVSEEMQGRVDELAQGLAPGSQVYVERGFARSYTLVWWVLAVFGALIVLVGTTTATALALTDARPDLATLGAVGASPWIRRRQAMAQAAVVGFLGALLGVVIGAVPGLAITWPLTAHSEGGHVVEVPWTLLGLVVLVVPLVSVVGAGLLTRSRLPMVRRIE